MADMEFSAEQLKALQTLHELLRSDQGAPAGLITDDQQLVMAQMLEALGYGSVAGDGPPNIREMYNSFLNVDGLMGDEFRGDYMLGPEDTITVGHLQTVLDVFDPAQRLVAAQAAEEPGVDDVIIVEPDDNEQVAIHGQDEPAAFADEVALESDPGKGVSAVPKDVAAAFAEDEDPVLVAIESLIDQMAASESPTHYAEQQQPGSAPVYKA